MPDSAYSHLEFSSETSVVVKMPSERVSNIDTRCLAPWPEHRLEYRIEVIAHDLYAVHQSHFEVCVARQQAADDGSFFVEFQERRQNRSAHYSGTFRARELSRYHLREGAALTYRDFPASSAIDADRDRVAMARSP
jgi:hypothetical protein